VIYTRSLAFSGQNILLCNQNDFWCCILWLLKYIVFFHRRSCQPRVHQVSCCTLSYCWMKWCDQCNVVGGQGSSPLDTYLGWWYCNVGDVGPPTPSSLLWSLMWSKNCWSSSSLKSSMFFSWNRIMGSLLMMGCSFQFDVCACYKGDVKYCDEGWFCWSKELYWASKKESFWDNSCVYKV